MRSNSVARVVIASLGVSMIMAAGCAEPPNAPSLLPKGPNAFLLSTASISPNVGPSAGASVATIRGIEFQSDTAVTVDGNLVDATVVNANTISLVMPAHAAGNVEVAVIRAPGQAAIKVNGGFIYIGAPEIRELFPNIGSTAGGTILFISGVTNAATVTVDGIGTAFEWEWGTDGIYVTMPAHAAGAVDVIVTDQYGQTGSAVFTYASPDTFDFNGEWQGWTTPESNSLPVVLTIRDNMVVGVSCGNPSLTIDPASAVANGEFSFADSDGVSMTGKILSPKSASGTINSASCGNRTWSAWKK